MSTSFLLGKSGFPLLALFCPLKPYNQPFHFFRNLRTTIRAPQRPLSFWPPLLLDMLQLVNDPFKGDASEFHLTSWALLHVLMLRCYYTCLNLWITLLDMFPESRGASLHISLGEKELKRLSLTWRLVRFLLFNWKNTCVCSFEN